MVGFLERGGAWVLAQGVVFVAIVLVGFGRPTGFSFPGRLLLGWGLMTVGLGIGVAAGLALGRNLTPYPKPPAGGTMVEHGPYRIVRHPIYTGVIVGFVGFALAAGDWLAFVMALVLVPFFYAKTTFEERHLEEAFDGYQAYRERVRYRILPGLI